MQRVGIEFKTGEQGTGDLHTLRKRLPRDRQAPSCFAWSLPRASVKAARRHSIRAWARQHAVKFGLKRGTAAHAPNLFEATVVVPRERSAVVESLGWLLRGTDRYNHRG